MKVNKMNIGILSDNLNTWNHLISIDNPTYIPRTEEQIRLRDMKKGFVVYVVRRVMSTFYSANDIQIDIDVTKLAN